MSEYTNTCNIPVNRHKYCVGEVQIAHCLWLQVTLRSPVHIKAHSLKGADWINLTQDRGQRRVLVCKVMIFRISWKAENSVIYGKFYYLTIKTTLQGVYACLFTPRLHYFGYYKREKRVGKVCVSHTLRLVRCAAETGQEHLLSTNVKIGTFNQVSLVSS